MTCYAISTCIGTITDCSIFSRIPILINFSDRHRSIAVAISGLELSFIEAVNASFLHSLLFLTYGDFATAAGAPLTARDELWPIARLSERLRRTFKS